MLDFIKEILYFNKFKLEKRTMGSIHLEKYINHEANFNEANRKINNGIYISEKDLASKMFIEQALAKGHQVRMYKKNINTDLNRGLVQSITEFNGAQNRYDVDPAFVEFDKNAQFHTMGASFGADIFPKLGHRKNANSTMGVRIGVLCSILVSYIICYTLSAGVIARGTALFMGICAATFLPAYFCSLFWKKATKEGALASLWTGALASLFAMLFLHKAEAGAVGLCNMLSGRDVLIDIYPWFAIDPILFALPLSTVAMVLTSLITYKKQEI